MTQPSICLKEKAFLPSIFSVSSSETDAEFLQLTEASRQVTARTRASPSPFVLPSPYSQMHRHCFQPFHGLWCSSDTTVSGQHWQTFYFLAWLVSRWSRKLNRLVKGSQKLSRRDVSMWPGLEKDRAALLSRETFSRLNHHMKYHPQF